jgi:hypothetical protein
MALNYSPLWEARQAGGLSVSVQLATNASKTSNFDLKSFPKK